MAADAGGGPWPAPAKLNLMLRVLGRRADGYHRLQTVFQFIDRSDSLSFKPRSDGRIRRVTRVVAIPAEQDLVVRAARLLRERTGSPMGADIHIEKRLPLGGGLGGGSSDAATTLVALNHIWGTGLGPQDLMALGLSLGADVPVFIRGRAAWGEGIGEELTPLYLPEPWYLVLTPSCVVSTADVFSDHRLTRNSPPITIPDFVAGEDGNDCLPVVRGRYPQVADALAWLGRVGRGRLTGTGASVFCAFATRAGADEACAAVPTRFQAFVARGMNRSPLLDVRS